MRQLLANRCGNNFHNTGARGGQAKLTRSEELKLGEACQIKPMLIQPVDCEGAGGMTQYSDSGGAHVVHMENMLKIGNFGDPMTFEAGAQRESEADLDTQPYECVKEVAVSTKSGFASPTQNHIEPLQVNKKNFEKEGFERKLRTSAISSARQHPVSLTAVKPRQRSLRNPNSNHNFSTVVQNTAVKLTRPASQQLQYSQQTNLSSQFQDFYHVHSASELPLTQQVYSNMGILPSGGMSQSETHIQPQQGPAGLSTFGKRRRHEKLASERKQKSLCEKTVVTLELTETVGFQAEHPTWVRLY